jgi:hypothetical protein
MYYLFIGGDADGKWKDVPDFTPWYKVPVLTEPSLVSPGVPDETAAYEIQEYKRSDWHVDAVISSVYVLNSMTPRDVWTALITGYKTAKEGRNGRK